MILGAVRIKINNMGEAEISIPYHIFSSLSKNYPKQAHLMLEEGKLLLRL